MSDHSKHVGLDVHKATIAVAVADAERGEARSFGTIPHAAEAVAKLVKKLSPTGESMRFYYEAGPCGYGLHRQITTLGHDCHVVAPSLIPRKAGDQIKTDRRDAMSLARLGRAGELTAVWVPDVEQEAMRDLMRCREDAKASQRQVRQQLLGFLLRHGRVFTEGRSNWTQIHTRWLEKQEFDQPVQQIVFAEYVNTVAAATGRVQMIDKRIHEALATWSLRPVVEGYMALRGVETVTAMTLVAELGDLTRFDSPRQLMSYLGLVPSEHSSGQRTRRGAITRAGNTHARRALIESAWSYQHPARKTKHLQRKAKNASEQVQAIAWKAQVRLCGRFRKMEAGGKTINKVAVATARELSGFIWAIYREVISQQRSDQARAAGLENPPLPYEARPGELRSPA